MPIDLSISRWVDVVAAGQWTREGKALETIGETVPALILDSPPLAEVHRLDLALFVVFEEASLRVSGALTRLAPSLDALNFCAQQTLDEARHHEMFRDRLRAASRSEGVETTAATEAILIPALRRFMERCYEVADGGSFIEAMVLMNLVLEGMAHPLYAYEERYWKPLDAYLARLVRAAFTDETRHVAFGADVVRTLLRDDPSRRAKAAALCAEARLAMDEIFTHYIQEFVGLFDAVAQLHPDRFAGAEFAPGRLIAETPYAEQVALIHASIDHEHSRLIARAGLD
jgi:Methane/Phenol/Toluene Hydroxylase